MNTAETKPTREELLQKLRNKKKQVEMHRMTKKNRDVTLEKFETKAKTEQEQMMNELKKCTPDQLKAFGLNQEMIDQLFKNVQADQADQPVEPVEAVEAVEAVEPENILQENQVESPLILETKSMMNNIFDIPDIHIPKMTRPMNLQSVNEV
jgi:hypothetical protein